jgi:group I intron endonuclease
LIGIYQIRNIKNNKVYIGSSIDIEKRWRSHRSNLDRNEHHSQKLQGDWNKYGDEYFIFEILEEIKEENIELSRHELYVIEQKYLDRYKPHLTGYNMSPYSGSLKKYELNKNKQLNKFRAKGNIRKIGNSLGVLLPVRFMKYMNLSNGSAVHINYKDGKIIIGTEIMESEEINEDQKKHKEKEIKELEEKTYSNAMVHIREYLESNFKPKL